MARTFSTAKTVSSLFRNETSSVFSPRGYAAVWSAQASDAKSGAAKMMLKKVTDESAKTAWVPDPVTGFYRPANQGNELSPAELRAMLINNRNKTAH